MQIKEPMDASVLFSSKMFLKQIEEYIAVLSTIDSREALFTCIESEFVAVSNYYLAIGNQEATRLEEALDTDTNEVYILHYALPETFKDTFLLHRDVLLQLYIANHKQLEGLTDLVQSKEHFSESIKVLIEATTFFSNKIKETSFALNQSEKGNEKLLDEIKHSKNPWGIYRSQFKNIEVQINEISNSSAPLSKSIRAFEKIRAYHSTLIKENTSASEKMKNLIGESIKSVSEMESIDEIPKLLSWIDHVVSGIINEEDPQAIYTQDLELKLKPLVTATIPIRTENGILLNRTLDFNKTVKKWFDFEILPELIDLWEHKTNMSSYFKHSLLNLKSSLLIEKSHETLDAMPSQLQTLKNVHATLSKNDDRLNKIATSISEKIEQNFQVSLVYENRDFLEVSLQSSLNQFAINKGNLLTALKEKLTKSFTTLNTRYENSALFNQQSDVDTSIECINYRMFKENNAHYDTLFLNKNFIGDLFILPRKEQETVFIKTKEQWNSGFNKAIVINGDALSGKSTFLGYVAQKFFNRNSVFLTIDSAVTFGGRKLKTTKNLTEALQYVKKNLSGKRPLVVIDTLELWRDDEHTLLENTRALLKFIEAESDNVLFVVSISKQMQKQLDKRVRFSEAFSTTIDLNKSTFEEIYKAFIFRHGASHKSLISEDGEIYTNKQIEQKVVKLVKKYHYNIGEILQAWTYGTTMVEDNKVIYKDAGYEFKDFFTVEEIIILKFVFLHKHINELNLLTYVGKNFENSYKSSLKRLTNLKVLLRDQNAQLHINPVLNSDIKRILTYRGTLN